MWLQSNGAGIAENEANHLNSFFFSRSSCSQILKQNHWVFLMHRSDVDFFAINDGHQLGKPEAWHGRIFNVSGQGSGLTRWWCLDIFLFSPENWGRFPFWLIFFKWVETTNYIVDLFFATNTQSLLKKWYVKLKAEGCSSEVFVVQMFILMKWP